LKLLGKVLQTSAATAYALKARPRKLTAHQRQEVLQRIAAGETQADIARLLNVGPPTISRLSASSPFVPAVVGL
jgi:DNA-binding NarL/FixJ family response regulator